MPKPGYLCGHRTHTHTVTVAAHTHSVTHEKCDATGAAYSSATAITTTPVAPAATVSPEKG